MDPTSPGCFDKLSTRPWRGGGETAGARRCRNDRGVHGAVPASRRASQQMGSLAEPTGTSAAGKIPEHFYAWFWGSSHSRRSCSPSTTGAWTATSSRSEGAGGRGAARGAHRRSPRGDFVRHHNRDRIGGDRRARALYLAVMAKFARQVWWWSLVGAIIGVVMVGLAGAS